MIGRWSELRAVIVFQSDEVTREEDASETSGELGAALLGIRVGESQLRTPRFELVIASARFLPLVSVDLEYHDGWCALKSPSTRVSGVISKWSSVG